MTDEHLGNKELLGYDRTKKETVVTATAGVHKDVNMAACS